MITFSDTQSEKCIFVGYENQMNNEAVNDIFGRKEIDKPVSDSGSEPNTIDLYFHQNNNIFTSQKEGEIFSKIYLKDSFFKPINSINEKKESNKENNVKVEEKRKLKKENTNMDLEKEKKEEKLLNEEKEKTKEKQENIQKDKKYKKKGKKEKERKDHKQKRIKSDFFKHIINNLNNILKRENIRYRFKKLPQCAVINVAKKENNRILNFTFNELLSYKYFERTSSRKLKNISKIIKRKKEVEKNKKDWKYNNKILNSLKNSDDKIINHILEKKMKDIYKDYLDSDEFQQSIKELKNEGKYYDYIHDYIIIAYNYFDYSEGKK